MSPERNPSEASVGAPQHDRAKKLTRERVVLSVEQWQRETEEMGEALGGAFELSDDVATTQLK